MTQLGRRRFRNYDDVATWRNNLQASVRMLVANRMELLLNQRLAELPHESWAEKQALCRWVNEELYTSGLAIRCPRTGCPALLHADPDGATGRFQIQLMSNEYGRKKTMSSVTLFPIEIMDNAIRPESVCGYWARKAKANQSSWSAQHGQ